MDKQRFFQATRRPTSIISVDGFGEVTITAMTIAQRLSLAERYGDDPAETTAWVVTVGVDGLTEDDLGQVMEMDPTIIKQIGDAIMDLSGMGDDEEGEVKKD